MQTSRDLSDGSVLWKRSFRVVNGGGIRFDRTQEWLQGVSSFVGLLLGVVVGIVIQVHFFFVRSYHFKCFDRASAVLAVKFCVSRPCNYCNNLCSKWASFVIILVKNEINALKGPS